VRAGNIYQPGSRERRRHPTGGLSNVISANAADSVVTQYSINDFYAKTGA
jgi:hypothetical protein